MVAWIVNGSEKAWIGSGVLSLTCFALVLFFLLVLFGDGRLASGDTLFVGFDLFFIAETELDRCAREIVGFADSSL